MGSETGLIGLISRNAKYAKITGVVMIIAGVFAVAAPFAAGVSAMIVLGATLLIGGIMQSVLAFQVGAFGRGVLVLLIGVLTVVTGVWMLREPISALGGMTLLLAAYFVATGTIEAIAAFAARPEQGWGWFLFSGVVSVLLGAMLWRQFPLSGIWAVGTLVGVRLLFGGFSIFSLGSIVHKGVVEISGEA